ncbi:hypothetical protein [Frigoriglobus tundricola]|uniref:Uncharacterized protein n=1 Tax=Frigoriglobus tundricola TaxID=2774151 RepID=A0A6M5YZK6_9BACT|nr:hypothetical protein [Frigoriglobus tundricola]QJW98860.1 hypothetical protein FTUN_6455 [Frigoriglobus tundricola]
MSSIGGVGSGISPSALLNLVESATAAAAAAVSASAAKASVSGARGVTPVASARPSDSLHLSGLSLLVAQLQQFQIQHPQLFQQVMVHIAGQLYSASLQTTGNPAIYLSNLANLFQSASQNGDLSAIS